MFSVTVAAALLLSCGQAGSSPERRADEYDVKAACIYNFLLFVDWPEHAAVSKSREIILGIIGQDPFGHRFEPVSNKPLGETGKTLTVKKLQATSPELRNCHVIFVAVSEQTHVNELLRSLGAAPILTVSDMQGFTKSGGMVELTTKNDRVRWAINRRAACDAKLVLRSQLLRSATAVVDH